MEEMSGTNCSQWRQEAMSLQKGNWRILCITDLAFQLHSLRTREPTEELPSFSAHQGQLQQCYTSMTKRSHTQNSWWGRKRHRRLHLQTKQGQTSKCCSFGLVLSSFIYAPCLWHIGKSINTWHMPLNSMNSKSSISVLVSVLVVSYCLLKTDEELNNFPRHLTKNQRKSHAVEFVLQAISRASHNKQNIRKANFWRLTLNRKM